MNKYIYIPILASVCVGKALLLSLIVPQLCTLKVKGVTQYTRVSHKEHLACIYMKIYPNTLFYRVIQNITPTYFDSNF